MCDPVSAGIATAVGAAASLYGTYSASKAASAQANAIAEQNRATALAQNQGFTQRLNAGLAQTAAQTAASTQTLADRGAAAQQMRTGQMTALKQYQDTLDAQNRQAEALRATGDTQAQQLLASTTGSALSDAQTAQAQQAAALLAPSTPQGPTTSDPGTGAPADAVAGDQVYRGAAARRTAEAATNIRSYGSKIGQVTSYDAPGQAVNLAVAANKGGIMPAQTAEQLLRSGSATRILPSQLNYQAATGTGNAADLLLQSKGQGALDAAGLSYGNAVDIANLTQSDQDTIAKNKSAQDQANAAYAASQGKVISGIGNLGLYGAGYYGGDPFGKAGTFGSQGPIFGTTADASIAAGGPPLAPGISRDF